MDNLKQRGRSRKKNQNGVLSRLIRGNRRKLSALLCASMVLNGTVTTFPVMAAEAENETASAIELTSSNLWKALDDAVSGSTAEAPEFSGSNKEAFEGLFDGDSNLYKLDSIKMEDNSELDVDVYAKVFSEELESDTSYDESSVEFVFLVSNRDESESKKVQIVIDGEVSSEVTIVGSAEVEANENETVKPELPAEPSTKAPAESEQDPAGSTEEGQTGSEETSAEESKPEESLPADSSEETTGSEDETPSADETTEAPSDVPEQGDGETVSEDETEAEVPETPAAEDNPEESQAPEEVPSTGDTEEDSSDIQTGTGDEGSVTDPDNSDEGKQEDSQPAEDSTPAADDQQDGEDAPADSAEPAEDSTPAADGSQSGNAEASVDSEEGSGDVTVAALSVSLHNAPYLAASGDPLATDAESGEETETLNTDNTVEEDTLGGTWIKDAALMDGNAVVAYVMSGSELNPKADVPTDPIDPDIPVWERSKSKTATNLDENYESRVTLSLPAAQETLESDVVFVLDKSTSADVEADAIEMLQNLNNQVSETGASVKVGVVIFNKEANVLGLTQLNDENMSKITGAIKQDISSGTNTHAGLLAAKEMLDNDTAVAASRKYVIFVSDGITYLFDKTANAINSQQASTGEYAVMAGNDCWGIRHYKEGGDKFLPSDWSEYLGDVGAHMDDVQEYIQPYGSMDSENHIPRGNAELPTTVDVALYKTAQVYSKMRAEGYHCYAMVADTGYGDNYPWGPSFMDYLAEGKEVSFDEIQNDIYYLLDAGSTVVDEIGYGDDYDFAFVKPEEMVLTVGGQKQEMTPIDENHWGFGKQLENERYPYEVTYYPNGSDELTGEHFVWAINVPVTNFAPVELTYTVKLINPRTEAGTYGKYDEDGSKNYSGLYTNKDATLNPVDSNGDQGDSEKFQKPTVSYTVTGSSSTPAEWETSKSKTATELNENRESTVTLGLPSAQESLASDVVFVLDKSTSAEVEQQILDMLADLKTEVEEKQAKVNVGVVIFNKEAHIGCGLTDLTTGYAEIENAIKMEISSGTNLHAGLLAGKAMLDEDTKVDANRKYLITISDGITYIYGETPTAVALQNGDKTNAFAGPDNWMTKYGTNDAPSQGWDNWMEQIAAQIQADGNKYEVPYGTDEPYIPYDERADHAMTIDRALYNSYHVYDEAKASGYHCYVDLASSNADHPWATSFMQFMADGKTVDFNDIKNDILYLLDAGSRVVDVIGEGTSNLGDPYDFTFVNDISRMNLTVGGVALDKKEIESVDGVSYSYGFGDRGDGNYRFVVTYYPNGTQDTDGEHFVWEINEAISNFAPVQFQYVVRLTTAPTADGTHGQYDGNGEHNYSGLLTNKEATLYPVDSNGTTYPAEEFPKPTVSYTVDNGGDTPVDPTPGEKQFTITINYYRRSDNAVLRDSETITLDANAAYDINDLVNMVISGYRWNNYSVPEGQTSDLTGTLTSNLVFNVYYVSSGGNSGGGTSGGGGGSTGSGPYNPSGGPGVTIDEDEVPLAPLPDTSTTTTIGEDEVPLSPLPKTGETSRRSWAVLMLSGALMAVAAVFTRKREEER